MRNLSIVTLVSLFFIFTLGVINLALVLEHKRQATERQTFAIQRFMMGMKMLHDTKQDKTNIDLKSLHVKISEVSTSLLLDQGSILFEDPFHSLINFNKKLYFVPNLLPPPPPTHQKNTMHPPLPRIVLEDTIGNTAYHVFLLGIVINGLLLIFFSVVLRKLLGLKNLKNAIKYYRESPVSSPIVLESGDELGQIADEFNITMDKIHHLKEARALFLRNILHELKTPIMKGKIISEQIEKISSKTALLRVFMRLESLLEESVKMEKFTSNEWHLQLEEYRLVDVLDHAMDLLMVETSKVQIKGRSSSGLVRADFELLAIAVKNLIDNALRHSQGEVEITLDKYKICIISSGQILSKEQQDFSRAFNRTQEGASTGLGLGLYIANAIVEKHTFSLKYHHLGGKNWFCIHFSKFEKNA